MRIKVCKYFKFLVLFIASSAIFPSLIFAGDCSSSAFGVKKTLVVGEQSIAALTRLKIIPKKWIGRKSLWENSVIVLACSDFISCPMGMLGPREKHVRKTIKQFSTYPVLLTKISNPCLYKPELTYEKMDKKLRSFGASPIVIDFSSGVEKGLYQLGEFFDVKKEAEHEFKKYQRIMKKAEKNLSKVKPGLKVAVISGVYQKSSGHSFLRIELPGGYTDKFILNLVKAENIGGKIFSSQELQSADKGHIPVKGKKLLELVKLNPDIIAVTGDSFPVEKELYKAFKAADKRINIYSLPFYSEADLLSYPEVLIKWADAFKDS